MSSPLASDVRAFVPARDFEQSLRFYTALGWTLNWRHDGLAEIELAGTRLYLQDFYVQAWAENFMIYVAVDDAQAWHDHASSVAEAFPPAAVRVLPPRREDYGAIATYVWDPCGVLIHFAEPVPST